MAEQVISLTSSDEEENNAEPPPKRNKPSPYLPPGVTLTLVSNNKQKEQIETVSLDSEDEENKPSQGEPKLSAINNDNSEKAKNALNVDCITLTDDEDDTRPQVNQVNAIIDSILGGNKSVSISKVKNSPTSKTVNETVSILDSDSDTESTVKEKDNFSVTETTDSNKNIVAKVMDKEGNDKKTNEESENEATEKNEGNKTIDKPNSETIEGDDEEMRENNSDADKTKAKDIVSRRSDEPEEQSVEILDATVSTNNSIVIDDSDEDMEKENHCENVDIEPFPVNMDKTSASDIPGPSDISKVETPEVKAAFKNFLKIVEEKIVDSSFEEILPKKVPIIQKYFKRCGSYVNEKGFETILYENTESIKRAPNSNAANTAVLAFHKIFEHLKSRVAESTIEIEEDHLPKVKKLEKTIKLLRKRIKQLEEAEVNWDDDEDSAYIMLDRYQARLNKVYAKYCEYIRRNPYSGRAIYDKISFVNSKHNVINQAISRKYKNSVNFPSYYELEKYIEKVVKKEKLDLSDTEIKIESKKCFKYLGNILQKKRRQELYDSHLDFIEFTEDPATKDISLENILRKNYSEGKEKIEKLYQKYVNKQDQGEDHISSDDAVSSDDSDSGKNNKKKKGKMNSKQVKKKGVKVVENNDDKNENSESEKSNSEKEAVKYDIKECSVGINKIDTIVALELDTTQGDTTET